MWVRTVSIMNVAWLVWMTLVSGASSVAHATCSDFPVPENHQMGCTFSECAAYPVNTAREELGCTGKFKDCKAYPKKEGQLLGCNGDECRYFKVKDGYTLGCSTKSCECYQNLSDSQGNSQNGTTFDSKPGGSQADVPCMRADAKPGEDDRIPVHFYSPSQGEWNLYCWERGCDWFQKIPGEQIGCTRDSCKSQYVAEGRVLGCTASNCEDRPEPLTGYQMGCDKSQCDDYFVFPGNRLGCTRKY